jgi:pyridoxamine 5'-phosphate oxidase
MDDTYNTLFKEGVMDLKECTQFATENPVCFIATADGDQPRVRTFVLEKADESGFYFTLVTTKKMYKQVCANPKTEICFFHADQDGSKVKQMRVTGMLEQIYEPDLLEKAYAKRQWIDQHIGISIKPLLATFRLRTGNAFFWTFENAAREEQIEVLHF